MESGSLKSPSVNKEEEEEARTSSSVTSGLLLSTSVAVTGSFVYGCSMSYSSPAQSEIMEELGLSILFFTLYSFFTSIMTFGGMITAAFSGKIAELIGRRQTMWVSDVFCLFGWLAIAFAQDKMLLNIGRGFLGFGVGLISYVGYVLSFGIGLGGLPWVIMSEVFPVNVKVTAGSLVTVSNWFFSWIVIFSFNFMMQWSAFGTYYIFSGVSLVSAIFVWTLMPETKGRTLEDIQTSLGQHS
ncbi:PREDICTED: sugar transporter ERD6-like 1 [Camelina sativa]|uniref:Sugar transporter ERD6-like 1 n=1 Tax=Camelina sativa TaxID=90675 RepID=A0ABM0YIH3_CAMSA|nr:PREDICTED: sugar transporter ERD6-like 1 [Camelina sativa]